MNDIIITTTTLIFAKAYGIYFSGVGIGLLTSPERFRNWYEDIMEESRRALFGGTVSLLIGSFIIATHNILVLDWPIIITLIGYWGVISGIGCLISNQYVKLFMPMVNANKLVYRLSGLGWLVLGLFLFYQGFFN